MHRVEVYVKENLPDARGQGLVRDIYDLGISDVADTAVINRLDVALYCTDGQGNRQAGYPHNPNGSMADIAGICDGTGRIFALMPHPERHICNSQHPRWSHQRSGNKEDGLGIFKNAVAWVRSL